MNQLNQFKCCLIALGLSGAAIVLLCKHIHSIQHETNKLNKLLEKEKQLRKVERKGRISAQQSKRQEIKNKTSISGYQFNMIGVIESPFPDRRGTPRQPNLVRAARGRIRFDKKLIQHEHFRELKEFSHVWVVWVFHENTNSDSKSIPAKIRPPRLHGARVGCLSTRSPHRPNPIGLSVSEVVSVGPDYIEIICVDMVDGTPVLDVKPYIPYDIVHSELPIAMAAVDDSGQPIRPTSLQVPSWIYEADIPMREVQFVDAAESALVEMQNEGAFKYCAGADEAKQLIRQVLRQDIRSTYQGRGRDGVDEKSSQAVENVLNYQMYECRLDSFLVKFQTLQTHISVQEVLRAN